MTTDADPFFTVTPDYLYTHLCGGGDNLITSYILKFSLKWCLLKAEVEPLIPQWGVWRQKPLYKCQIPNRSGFIWSPDFKFGDKKMSNEAKRITGASEGHGDQ